jgi:hypothetical protein
MKKPFLYALNAAIYIVFIVFTINAVALPGGDDTILIPIMMLSLFVLSAAIMGFLFLSEPLSLFLENKKPEAVVFFGRTVGFFACFAAAFLLLFFFLR